MPQALSEKNGKAFQNAGQRICPMILLNGTGLDRDIGITLCKRFYSRPGVLNEGKLSYNLKTAMKSNCL